MFPGNLFYQSILLIFYFDNHIELAECSLLSRAKNPINIVTDMPKTAEEQVYFELPGTMQRMVPTRRSQNKVKSSAPVMQEYALYQNQPLRTPSSLSNFNRYVVEKPFVEPESLNRLENLRVIPVLDKKTHHEPKRPMTDWESDNYYGELSSITKTTNINAYEPSRTIPISENIDVNQVSQKFISLDKINRYKYKTVTRTTTVNDNQPIAVAENVYQDQVSRTFSDLDKGNRYDPIRTITDAENVDYYEVTRALPTLKHKNIHLTRTNNILKKVYQYQPLSTLDRHEPVVTAPIAENIDYLSMETILSNMNIDHGKIIRNYPVSDDINNYEPVRSSPSPDYYRYEPSRTAPLTQMLGRDEHLQANVNRDELEIKYKSLDNNYGYELERVSSPVKVYQQTLVTENTTADINRYEPVRTSVMPVYINPYEPIKFSAFYVDESSRTTKFKLSYYMNPLEASKIADVFVSQSLKSIPIPKLPYRLDASRYLTSKNFELSSTRLIFNKLMETYQLTPFRQPELIINSKSKAQFTPYLTLETSTSPINTNFWETVSTSKSPEYYWNEFMQVYPERRRENQNQYFSPVQTTLNVYKNKERLKTMIVDGNVYQLLPFETSRAVEDYWNEFMRNEPARTYVVKKTVPLRTSTLQIPPSRAFKLTTTFYEDESQPYPELSVSSYRTMHLTDSNAFSSFYQKVQSRTVTSGQNIEQHEPLRTSKPKDYFYPNVPVRTSGSPHIVYEHVPLRTSRFMKNLYKMTPLRSSRSASSPYPISTTRSTRSKQDLYQRAFVGTSTTQDYLNLNKPFRTSTLPRHFFESEPSRTSTPLEKVNKNEGVRPIVPTQNAYTYEPLDQPTGLVSFDVSGPTKTVLETNYQTKYRQGFRTLWQPTVMIPASKIMPTRTTSEQDLKPSRTTKVFNWNFNDAEAAWPKVELILSTTERRAAVTKPKRKFATYFPFYLRGQASPSENNQVTAGSENESGSEKLASTEESKKDDSDEDQDVRCYSCGLDISDIPYYPSCYHVFDQKGSTHVNKKVRYMVRCINPKKKDEKKGKRRIIRKIKNYTIPEERKLYRGGCFKRFVEFGEIYSERGCRTLDPIIGKSFASFRLAALEKTLVSVDEGCVVSPQAVLTPFARGVSLFARYHACVCQGKYCNDAMMVTPSAIVILFNIFLRIF